MKPSSPPRSWLTLASALISLLPTKSVAAPQRPPLRPCSAYLEQSTATPLEDLIKKVKSFYDAKAEVIVQFKNLVGTFSGTITELTSAQDLVTFQVTGAYGSQSLPVTEDLMIIAAHSADNHPLIYTPQMEQAFSALNRAYRERKKVIYSNEQQIGELVGEVTSLYVQQREVHFHLHGAYGEHHFRLEPYNKIELLP